MRFYDSSTAANDTANPVSSAAFQSIMKWVYVWMAFGLLITTVVAAVTYQNTTLLQLRQNTSIVIGAFIAEIAIVFGLSLFIQRIQPSVAAVLFMVYAAINGFTLSVITQLYTGQTITAAFVTTVILFGTMSVIGFTTKVDLGKYSTYLFIGLIGLLIATVVNIFLQSSAVEFAISLFGVVLFTALTAYDTQKIKRMAASSQAQSNEQDGFRVSIIGALILYLDFINLFIFLLRLFGRRR